VFLYPALCAVIRRLSRVLGLHRDRRHCLDGALALPYEALDQGFLAGRRDMGRFWLRGGERGGSLFTLTCRHVSDQV
jgi:hypothetical protein